MDTMDLPARSGSNVSGEESSGSSGMYDPCRLINVKYGDTNAVAIEDRVRKFQRTTDNGSRLRKTSATNAMSAAARPPPAINNPALRGRAKHPLGPRERPQDFSKPR
jgi:dual specificity tyrosine-phosphorylation-regulated kinase 2/3/4